MQHLHEFGLVMGAIGCPTPRKEGFASQQGARRKLFSLMKNSREGQRRLQLAPYKCRCGRWHVGHGR